MNWKVLAGLRFFLSWIVVCAHMRFFIPGADKNLLFIFDEFNALSAVLGFLIISGYSIATSIARKPEGFYERRVLRIYPLYLVSVIVSIIPFLIVGSKITIPRQDFLQSDLWVTLANFVLLQGIAVKPIALNPVLWTLSVEFICYLLAPFFIKIGNKAIAALVALSSIAYVAFPYIYQSLYPGSKVPFYSGLIYGLPFLLFLWAWLLGFLYFTTKEKTPSKIMLLGLGIMLLILNDTYIGKTGLVTYTICALLLMYSSYIKLPKPIADSLNYLGDISYPLYLFHVPTIVVAYALLGIKDSTTLGLLSIVMAIVFYHAIDIPLRKRKNDTLVKS